MTITSKCILFEAPSIPRTLKRDTALKFNLKWIKFIETAVTNVSQKKILRNEANP